MYHCLCTLLYLALMFYRTVCFNNCNCFYNSFTVCQCVPINTRFSFCTRTVVWTGFRIAHARIGTALFYLWEMGGAGEL